MGIRKIAEYEARVCDFCFRENQYLRTCIRCGREFCLTCNGIIPGCGIAPKTCRDCSGSHDVQRLCDQYAPKLSEILKERDAKIAGTGKKAEGK
jgi:hypothetical protein